MLTGHSLGGGVVNILALQFSEGDAARLLPAGTRVKCVSFAPPPVFTTDDQELLERTKEVVYIYIHNSDIVPRLSLANVAQLLIAHHEVDALQLSPMTKMALLRDHKEEELEKVSQVVQEARQGEFRRLKHPGKIFYMRSPHAAQRKPGEMATGEPREIFEDLQEFDHFSGCILLLDTMVTDHRSASYIEALQNIVNPGDIL